MNTENSTAKRTPGSLHPVVSRLVKCKCGQTPKLVEIGKWPAQYQAECECGKVVLGRYYSHHESHIRHAAAKRDAIQAWAKSANADISDGKKDL